MTTTWQDIGTEGRPVRIQRKRTKGWKMPPNTVYVGRPTGWGNPFKIGVHGDAAQCTALYRDCIKRLETDLEALRKLRDYLIWNGLGEPARILIAAIDDYAGHLTGDRAALHSKPHSIL